MGELKRYFVEGYQRISIWGHVDAESEEDAIERAFNGGFLDPDTDPDKSIDKRKWTARPAPGAKLGYRP
jgi:hypothetical protein